MFYKLLYLHIIRQCMEIHRIYKHVLVTSIYVWRSILHDDLSWSMAFLSVGVSIFWHEALGPSFNRQNQILSSRVIRHLCLCHVWRVACKEVGERGLMLEMVKELRKPDQSVHCKMTEQHENTFFWNTGSHQLVDLWKVRWRPCRLAQWRILLARWQHVRFWV